MEAGVSSAAPRKELWVPFGTVTASYEVPASPAESGTSRDGLAHVGRDWLLPLPPGPSPEPQTLPT